MARSERATGISTSRRLNVCRIYWIAPWRTDVRPESSAVVITRLISAIEPAKTATTTDKAMVAARLCSRSNHLGSMATSSTAPVKRTLPPGCGGTEPGLTTTLAPSPRALSGPYQGGTRESPLVFVSRPCPDAA
jgi:hypothetical protein